MLRAGLTSIQTQDLWINKVQGAAGSMRDAHVFPVPQVAARFNAVSATRFGGGVKRRFVHGESDRIVSYPTKDAVRPEDLAATIYYLLGIDPHIELYAPGDRPVLISEGKPVTGSIS